MPDNETTWLAESEVVRDLAFQAAGIAPLLADQVQGLIGTVGSGGEVYVTDLETYLPRPRTKAGAREVYDTDSFVDYVERHLDADHTEIWADPPARRGGAPRIMAVLDSHGSEPGWGQHKVHLVFRRDPDWQAWLERDNQWHTQGDFAEFLTQHAVNVVVPDSATILELVQSIQGTKSVAWESSKRIANGETQLVYKETVDARAGHAGDLTIPSTLELALRPFEGTSFSQVIARFRYRIEGQSLRLGYVLERPGEVERRVFDDVLASVRAYAEEAGVPVFVGAPL